MRVVLYAEGPGETGTVEMPPLYARRSRITEDALGPAHVLTRRCIARITEHDERSIQFQAPLMPRGKPARGSQLIDPRTLAKLLTWTHPDMPPDLVILLVDADGSDSRRSELESAVETRPMSVPPAVVALAVQEFESWLLPICSRCVESQVETSTRFQTWRLGVQGRRSTLSSVISATLRTNSSVHASTSAETAISKPWSVRVPRSGATLATCAA